MKPDAKIVGEMNYRIVAFEDVLAFWIVCDAWVQVDAENPWAATSYTHDLGNGRYLLEMDSDHISPWKYPGVAFITSGKILGASCQGPTGIVQFK